MLHILERFFLHFISSTALTMIFFFVLRYWVNRNAKVMTWIAPQRERLLVTAALLVFALLPLREPFDIWAGNNSLVKSFFDQASWFLGAAVSAWGLYRFGKD